jgi:uncharacterized protein with gpF-like domain
MNSNEFVKKFDTFTKRAEKKYRPKINNAIRSQLNAYLRTGNMSSIKSDEILYLLKNLYLDVGVGWARISNSYIKQRLKADGQMGFSERVSQLIISAYGPQLLNTSQKITDTTIETIRSILSQAAVNGWSIEQITQKIQSPDLSYNRAKLIARTEVISSANGAAVENAKSLGFEVKKEWVAALDSRTRADHRKLNGQVVGMNELFSVVDKEGVTRKMLQPGDRTHGAGPGQICNCRCAVIFVE